MSTTLARKTSKASLTLINLLSIQQQVSSSKSADFIFVIFFHPHTFREKLILKEKNCQGQQIKKGINVAREIFLNKMMYYMRVIQD